MRSKKDARDYIDDALNVRNDLEHKQTHHIGKLEIYSLLDFIYDKPQMLTDKEMAHKQLLFY